MKRDLKFSEQNQKGAHNFYYANLPLISKNITCCTLVFSIFLIFVVMICNKVCLILCYYVFLNLNAFPLNSEEISHKCLS